MTAEKERLRNVLAPTAVRTPGLGWRDSLNAEDEEGKAVVKSPMKTVILDFIRLEESHTAKYLASKVIDCLNEFGIADKVRFLFSRIVRF